MKKRTALKVFRVKQGLTQAQCAEKIGCSCSLYSLIEQGKRAGTIDFWNKLKTAFNVSDADMWGLTEVDKKKKDSC